MAKSVFDQKSLFIITGVARGYGQALLMSIAKQLSQGSLGGKGSMLVGTSRRQERFAELTKDVAAVCPDVGTKFVVMELDQVQAMPESFAPCLDVDPLCYDAAVLIHNAGDAGDFTVSCKQSADGPTLKGAFDLNATSFVLLNGAYLRRFDGSKTQLFVVNISSLLAVEAFPGFHQYCMTKAARDMYMRVLAKEQEEVRCLNWAPGPMPTDLYKQLCAGANSEGVRESFSKMLEEKSYVTCEDSAAKMVACLAKNEFESGVHLDYYDV